MREERSILEYVSERIDFSGKLKNGYRLEYYLKKLNGDDYTIDKDNFYYGDNAFYYLSNEKENENLDFRTGALIDKMLNNLDSTEFEKYIKSKDICLEKNLESIESIIEKHSDIDRDRLKAFCKYNISKTQSTFGLYVYLLLAKNVDIKKDEQLYKDILKIALIEEYTKFIDDYLIDNMPDSDYIRGYLLKRVKMLNPAIDNMFNKKEIVSFEDRNWVITEFVRKLFGTSSIEKIDLLDILENWDLSETQFLGCVDAIRHELGLHDKSYETLAYIGKCIRALAKRYKEQPLNLEIIKEISFCLDPFVWSFDTPEGEIEKYRKILSKAIATPEALELIKEKLYSKDLDNNEMNKLYKIVANLNITEFYLELYNKYKEDPVQNYRMVYIFENQKDLELKALTLLYEKLNWDEIIGEYNRKVDWKHLRTVEDVLMSRSVKYPELGIKVCTKMLKAKDVMYRQNCIFYLYELKFNDVIFPKELLDAIDYLIKNELNTRVKEMAKSLIGTNDEDLDFATREKKYSFNLVGSNEEPQEKEKKEDKKAQINLKEPGLLHKFNGMFSGSGIDAFLNNQIIYFTETQDEYYGYCQGEEFGEEYMVRILKDKNYNFKEAYCSCEKCNKDKYCEHVAAMITHISKENDRRKDNDDK